MILESMKMEMPVEAELEGTVAEILCRGGAGGLGGRPARRPRVTARTALADGKLRLDRPADGVVRLTIDHAAKRNALDHEILDAIAETVPHRDARCLLLTAEGPVFSRRLRHRQPAPRRFAEAA